MFEPIGRDDGSVNTDALLLTEQGSERRAGVWCVDDRDDGHALPLDKLGPEAATITADELAALFEANSMRVHGFLRDQRMVAGVGRRLANEVCHTRQDLAVRQHPQARRRRCRQVVDALQQCIAEGLAVRTDARRHEFVEGPAERGPRPDRRAVPRVRRHDPCRVVLGLHGQLLPDVPDRRQDPRRQHDAASFSSNRRARGSNDEVQRQVGDPLERAVASTLDGHRLEHTSHDETRRHERVEVRRDVRWSAPTCWRSVDNSPSARHHRSSW